MYKSIVALMSFVVFTSQSFAITINNELEQELKENTSQTLPTEDKSISYTSVKSCKEIDTIMTDLLKQYKNNYYRPMEEDIAWGGIAMEKSLTSLMQDESTSATNNTTIDFSTTNNQVAGVDEADIMKTNGNYIYYINNEDNTIEVLQTPLSTDKKNIDLTQSRLVSKIKLPSSLQGQKNLFLQNNTLVLVAQWQTASSKRISNPRLIDNSSKLMVVSYDISKPENPTLAKVTSLDGQYHQARLIDGTMRIIANQYINRRSINNNTSSITSRSLLPKITQKIAWEKGSKRFTAPCDSLQYVIPDQDSAHMSYPSLSYIYTIDVATKAKPETTILLWNTQEIYMSQTNLYLLESYRSQRWYACPFNSRCMMPRNNSIGQTLIHKFKLKTDEVQYQTTALVPGSPLTQYSMDEDNTWNFRILTSKWIDQVSTDLHILDKDLNIIWGIYDIEPGEQFQSSRYIGDKLYLVTFRQTDPLFVIDLTDSNNPKIIGELKIPGYSTYLHPHSTKDWKQYLLWLGYNVATNQRWATVNEWLQLALYEVNYNAKETLESRCDSIKSFEHEYKKCIESVDTSRIQVRVIDQETIATKWSQSEALHNPKMFVMNTKKDVILPITEQIEQQIGEYCYDTYTQSGTESIKIKRCDPQYDYKAGFIGLKSFATDTVSGIQVNKTYDYSSLFEKTTPKTERNQWSLNVWDLWNKWMRAWYIGQALYMVNSDFAHFIDPSTNTTGTYIMIDKKLQ